MLQWITAEKTVGTSAWIAPEKAVETLAWLVVESLVEMLVMAWIAVESFVQIMGLDRGGDLRRDFGPDRGGGPRGDFGPSCFGGDHDPFDDLERELDDPLPYFHDADAIDGQPAVDGPPSSLELPPATDVTYFAVLEFPDATAERTCEEHLMGVQAALDAMVEAAGQGRSHPDASADDVGKVPFKYKAGTCVPAGAHPRHRAWGKCQWRHLRVCVPSPDPEGRRERVRLGGMVAQGDLPGNGIVAGCCSVARALAAFRGGGLAAQQERRPEVLLAIHVDDIDQEVAAEFDGVALRPMASSARGLKSAMESELGAMLASTKGDGAAVTEMARDAMKSLGRPERPPKARRRALRRAQGASARHLGVDFRPGRRDRPRRASGRARGAGVVHSAGLVRRTGARSGMALARRAPRAVAQIAGRRWIWRAAAPAAQWKARSRASLTWRSSSCGPVARPCMGMLAPSPTRAEPFRHGSTRWATWSRGGCRYAEERRRSADRRQANGRALSTEELRAAIDCAALGALRSAAAGEPATGFADLEIQQLRACGKALHGHARARPDARGAVPPWLDPLGDLVSLGVVCYAEERRRSADRRQASGRAFSAEELRAAIDCAARGAPRSAAAGKPATGFADLGIQQLRACGKALHGHARARPDARGAVPPWLDPLGDLVSLGVVRYAEERRRSTDRRQASGRGLSAEELRAAIDCAARHLQQDRPEARPVGAMLRCLKWARGAGKPFNRYAMAPTEVRADTAARSRLGNDDGPGVWWGGLRGVVGKRYVAPLTRRVLAATRGAYVAIGLAHRRCHLLHPLRLVGVLESPDVLAKVTGHLSPGQTFFVGEELRHHGPERRTFLKLAVGSGWVPECSRKEPLKVVVERLSAQPVVYALGDALRVVRFLEVRIAAELAMESLRTSALQWMDIGGAFSAPVLGQDYSTPSPVGRRRALAPTSKLKSKTFMLTYNQLSIAATSFGAFKTSRPNLKTRFGARARSRCERRAQGDTIFTGTSCGLTQLGLQGLENAGAHAEPREHPVANDSVEEFAGGPMWRRPVLFIAGGTSLGKSMLGGADSQKGVADALLLNRVQEGPQGRPKVLMGARSATTKHAHAKTYARRAIVAAVGLSADDLRLLRADCRLSDPRDEVVARAAKTVTGFLDHTDLSGPALFHDSINGADPTALRVQALALDARGDCLADA
ncbi:unnamed protein product [Prorocentrum cordatum]|uniref:Uncharacterized protein n=1 Tax=Prorocentrum cordatum TaxID=2364126 RepID=A0ABN9SHD0_9DINO|nr:unnamed protein product [Polarella glacialis]